MKSLWIGLSLLSSISAFAYPLECMMSKKETLGASNKSAQIKLLSPGLNSKDISIRIGSGKIGKNFLGFANVKCMSWQESRVNADGAFTLPKLEGYVEGGFLSIVQKVDDEVIYTNFKRPVLGEEETLEKLVDTKQDFTLAEVDVSHMYENESARYYLFDWTLREGDRVYVPLSQRCKEGDAQSPCNFTVVNGVLVN